MITLWVENKELHACPVKLKNSSNFNCIKSPTNGNYVFRSSFVTWTCRCTSWATYGFATKPSLRASSSGSRTSSHVRAGGQHVRSRSEHGGEKARLARLARTYSSPFRQPVDESKHASGNWWTQCVMHLLLAEWWDVLDHSSSTTWKT